VARFSELLVLFDLDGTVLTFDGLPPGPGRTALARAMHELHGVEGGTNGLRLAGGTDRSLARSMLVRAGLATGDEAIDGLLQAYLAHLEAILHTRRYRPIGDAARVIAELEARGSGVGIATGNVRHGARLKLVSAGLLQAFDLTRGGYGCDADERADIVRTAVSRCRRSEHEIIVVVGDTERDVGAARAVGARAVGVAVDARARAELEAAGADVVVDGCGDDLIAAIAAWEH
jgi:phosphoglycolate phosphatase-like HAD superfamily hydrolase